MSMPCLGWLVASYRLGAIPTSWITVRLVKGQDLRRLGSGNLGATNLYRQLGWKFAVPVGLFDLAKGAVPVMLFGPMAGGGPLAAALLGVVAVIGHVFSIFVGFKGGKGVATGAGVVLGLAPRVQPGAAGMGAPGGGHRCVLLLRYLCALAGQ